jgi:hypothetical protein
MISQKANLKTEQIKFLQLFSLCQRFSKNYVGRARIWHSKTHGKANAFAQREHIFTIIINCVKNELNLDFFFFS